MRSLEGIGTIDRERMAAVIRGTKGTVSVNEASQILDVISTDAAKMLSRWTKKGWFSRIKRGLYIPVPLESKTVDIPLEDPWLVADRLFAPCYIGGWSAAEYFDLTEQIFSTIVVMTCKRSRDLKPVIKGTPFMLRTVPEKTMFGLKPVWRGQAKIQVSDTSRTMLDLLANPELGGGIRSVKDMLGNFLISPKGSLEQLVDYAKQLGNGVVFKRLGFLIEFVAPDEKKILEECRQNLTQGNAKLDLKLDNTKLITRWRLWVPENWKRMKTND
ncbi:MAG: hypothetical protein GXP56_13540 [Deltaproteobacteria bacterium]|nr:hypothetical protein [Deltaproteobacteria bacterium]